MPEDIILSVDGNTTALEQKITAAIRRAESVPFQLNTKNFALGRITGDVAEFNKSLAASNARVIAFGASAGLIAGVSRAFKELVVATVDTEKRLADINVILNATDKNFKSFSSTLFKTASDTGQAFGEVATAATELARQGLSAQETLKRTRDSMILVRLTGMDTEEAVRSLTSAVNTFKREALDSTTIINRLANVDANFAVSSKDLAQAISRVGSSAQDAGVQFNELLAIVTSVQQSTGRGGAVIGNALKSIFTRVERSSTLDDLERLGIAVRDVEGKTLPAIRILTELAKTYDTLSEAQRSSIAEHVGGVFQINILKAALGDLNKQYSTYKNVLDVANSTTDEAMRRNEALNQTVAASAQKTVNSLTQMASKVGTLTLAPVFKKVLGAGSSISDALSGAIDGEGAGSKVANGILRGIGNVLSGPGLIMVGTLLLKLTERLGRFSFEAARGVMEMGGASQRRHQIEEAIVGLMQNERGLAEQIASGTMSLVQKEQLVLNILREQQMARQAMVSQTHSIAGGLMTRGVYVTTKGAIETSRAKASGFVPSEDALAETVSAVAAGYTPGAIKTMTIPNYGRIVYNSAETVRQFPGLSQPAIMPPSASPAGSAYRKAFSDKLGFDPYRAARGAIPNFADEESAGRLVGIDRGNKARFYFQTTSSKDDTSLYEQQIKKLARGRTGVAGAPVFRINAPEVGLLFGGSSPAHLATAAVSGKEGFKTSKSDVGKALQSSRFLITFTAAGLKPEFGNFKTAAYEPLLRAVSDISNSIGGQAIPPELRDAHTLSALREQLTPKKLYEVINPQGMGRIFEGALHVAIAKSSRWGLPAVSTGSSRFDFPTISPTLAGIFNLGGSHISKADAKLNLSEGAISSVASKILLEKMATTGVVAPELGKYFDYSPTNPETGTPWATGNEFKGLSFNKKGASTFKSRGFIPSFARKVIDRDRLLEYLKVNPGASKNAATLYESLIAAANPANTTLLMGPAGIGKTTFAMGRKGEFALSPSDISPNDSVVIISASENVDSELAQKVKSRIQLTGSPDEISRRRGLRDTINQSNLFGRAPGSARYAPTSTITSEAILKKDFPKHTAILQASDGFRWNRKPFGSIPDIREIQAAVTIGGFSPPTMGHARIFDEALKTGKQAVFGASRGVDREFDLGIGVKDKVALIQKMYPNALVIPVEGIVPSVFAHNENVYRMDKGNSVVVVGTDRVDSVGKSFQSRGFGVVEVKRDANEGLGSVSQISATEVRKLVAAGDVDNPLLAQALHPEVLSFIKKNKDALVKRAGLIAGRKTRIEGLLAEKETLGRKKKSEAPEITARRDWINERVKTMEKFKFLNRLNRTQPLSLARGLIPSFSKLFGTDASKYRGGPIDLTKLTSGLSGIGRGIGREGIVAGWEDFILPIRSAESLATSAAASPTGKGVGATAVTQDVVEALKKGSFDSLTYKVAGNPNPGFSAMMAIHAKKGGKLTERQAMQLEMAEAIHAQAGFDGPFETMGMFGGNRLPGRDPFPTDIIEKLGKRGAIAYTAANVKPTLIKTPKGNIVLTRFPRVSGRDRKQFLSNIQSFAGGLIPWDRPRARGLTRNVDWREGNTLTRGLFNEGYFEDHVMSLGLPLDARNTILNEFQERGLGRTLWKYSAPGSWAGVTQKVPGDVMSTRTIDLPTDALAKAFDLKRDASGQAAFFVKMLGRKPTIQDVMDGTLHKLSKAWRMAHPRAAGYIPNFGFTSMEDMLAFVNERADMLPEKWNIQKDVNGNIVSIAGQPIHRPDGSLNTVAIGAANSYLRDPMGIERGLRGRGYYKTAARRNTWFKSKWNAQRSSSGFIPNFSAVDDAAEREAAIVGAENVRIDRHPALMSTENPEGLGIFNTLDEPNGLSQGIWRARAEGKDPRGYGVPNFADLIPPTGMIPSLRPSREQRELEERERIQQKEAEKLNSKREAAAQKRMAMLMNLSFAASFVGGAAGGFTENQQVQRGFAGFGNALSIGGMVAGMGGPIAPAIGAAIGGFMAFKSIMDNLRPSFEDLAKNAQELSSKQQEQIQNIQNFNQSVSQVEELIRSNAKPQVIAAARMQQTAASADLSPSIRKELVNATPEERQQILAREQIKASNAISLASMGASAGQAGDAQGVSHWYNSILTLGLKKKDYADTLGEWGAENLYGRTTDTEQGRKGVESLIGDSKKNISGIVSLARATKGSKLSGQDYARLENMAMARMEALGGEQGFDRKTIEDAKNRIHDHIKALKAEADAEEAATKAAKNFMSSIRAIQRELSVTLANYSIGKAEAQISRGLTISRSRSAIDIASPQMTNTAMLRMESIMRVAETANQFKSQREDLGESVRGKLESVISQLSGEGGESLAKEIRRVIENPQGITNADFDRLIELAKTTGKIDDKIRIEMEGLKTETYKQTRILDTQERGQREMNRIMDRQKAVELRGGQLRGFLGGMEGFINPETRTPNLDRVSAGYSGTLGDINTRWDRWVRGRSYGPMGLELRPDHAAAWYSQARQENAGYARSQASSIMAFKQLFPGYDDIIAKRADKDPGYRKRLEEGVRSDIIETINGQVENSVGATASANPTLQRFLGSSNFKDTLYQDEASGNYSRTIASLDQTIAGMGPGASKDKEALTALRGDIARWQEMMGDARNAAHQQVAELLKGTDISKQILSSLNEFKDAFMGKPTESSTKENLYQNTQSPRASQGNLASKIMAQYMPSVYAEDMMGYKDSQGYHEGTNDRLASVSKDIAGIVPDFRNMARGTTVDNPMRVYSTLGDAQSKLVGIQKELDAFSDKSAKGGGMTRQAAETFNNLQESVRLLQTSISNMGETLKSVGSQKSSAEVKQTIDGHIVVKGEGMTKDEATTNMLTDLQTKVQEIMTRLNIVLPPTSTPNKGQ